MVPGTWSGTAVPHPSRVHRGRFTVCQSRGQRSAGVRKSISERSLSTSFNLMKPLFVKADALLAIPLKQSRAQRLALKEQEGVPFPFTCAIQQAPKTNTPHTERSRQDRGWMGGWDRSQWDTAWRCCARGRVIVQSPRMGKNWGMLSNGVGRKQGRKGVTRKSIPIFYFYFLTPHPYPNYSAKENENQSELPQIGQERVPNAAAPLDRPGAAIPGAGNGEQSKHPDSCVLVGSGNGSGTKRSPRSRGGTRSLVAYDGTWRRNRRTLRLSSLLP